MAIMLCATLLHDSPPRLQLLCHYASAIAFAMMPAMPAASMPPLRADASADMRHMRDSGATPPPRHAAMIFFAMLPLRALPVTSCHYTLFRYATLSPPYHTPWLRQCLLLPRYDIAAMLIHLLLRYEIRHAAATCHISPQLLRVALTLLLLRR